MDNIKTNAVDREKDPGKIIFYTFIHSVIPIISLFTVNFEEVSLIAVIFPLLLALIVTGVVLAVSGFCLRSRESGALFTFWSLLLVFLYGPFSELLLKLQFGDFVFVRNMHRIPVYTGLFLAVGWGLARLHKRHTQLTGWLNTTSLWLLLVMCVSLACACVAPARYLSSQPVLARSPRESSLKTDTLPDIYYIILDGYASAGTLSSFFGYDNQPFIQYLQSKGFYLPAKARSNYAMTMLSIPSSLGMDYWQREDGKEMPPNSVKPFLEQNGYDCITISSMNPAARSPIAQGSSWRGLLYNEFMLRLLRTTIMDAVALRFKFYSSKVRENLLASLEQLKRVPSLGGRKFVFAHILCPHPPYVFKANGEPAGRLSDVSLNVYKTPWDDKAGYVEQVRFINSKTREIIDTILRDSSVPPIIIVQGDHGPNLTVPDRRTAVDIGMHILNAYYLPGGGSSALYDTITPVNSFRVVFNHYFRAGLPILEDKCYFSTFVRPFQFFNVTAETAR